MLGSKIADDVQKILEEELIELKLALRVRPRIQLLYCLDGDCDLMARFKEGWLDKAGFWQMGILLITAVARLQYRSLVIISLFLVLELSVPVHYQQLIIILI
jgi:hypothetical protein